MKNVFLFLILLLTACSIEQPVKPECCLANLVVTDDNARLVFVPGLDTNVDFTIETQYGMVPGYWTPDMFSCIGWNLDYQEHQLIISNADCKCEFVIPALNQ